MRQQTQRCWRSNSIGRTSIGVKTYKNWSIWTCSWDPWHTFSIVALDSDQEKAAMTTTSTHTPVVTTEHIHYHYSGGLLPDKVYWNIHRKPVLVSLLVQFFCFRFRLHKYSQWSKKYKQNHKPIHTHNGQRQFFRRAAIQNTRQLCKAINDVFISTFHRQVRRKHDSGDVVSSSASQISLHTT